MEVRALIFLLLTILAFLAVPASDQGLRWRVVRTQHFEVAYEKSSPRFAAQYYAQGMESAYRWLVLKRGFRDGGVEGPAHKWRLMGNINFGTPEQWKSHAVHEYFHSIQHFGYSLVLSDNFLKEGTARWAQREVFSQCVKCYLELLEFWLIGGTDVGTPQQLAGGYQAGLFWNFVTDRYGGAQLIRKLFEHPDIRLGVSWPKSLSQLMGKSFLDLWAEFAVALAARRVPDAKHLYPTAEQKTPYAPVPVFVGEWSGNALTINLVNWENPLLKICSEKRRIFCPLLENIAAVGSPLKVRHSYGIHFLRIVPKSEKSLALRFHGNPDTEFRVYLVAQRALGQHELFALQAECVLSQPAAYALLHVVVTRGEKGSGEYQLNLQQPQNPDLPQCQRLAHR